MDISHDEYKHVFRPIIYVIYLIAILPMIFRLIYRTWARQLWWDDLWAGIAMINAAILFCTFLLASFQQNPSEAVANAVYVLTLVTANLALWSSRLSVAVTIVRVIATGKMQLLSKIIAVVLGLFSITLLIERLIICGPPSSARFLCSNPTLAGYLELVMSLSADLWLLAAPAYLLWKMNLRKKHHRLLQAIFACEVMVLVASTVHSVYMAKQIYLLQALTAHFEIGISLIVCNLLFLVTYVYRVFRRGEESFEESTTTAPSRHPESSPVEMARSSVGTMISLDTSITPLTSVFLSYQNSTEVGNSVFIMSHPERHHERRSRSHLYHSI